jgi:nitrogen fixation NifU-like protein
VASELEDLYREVIIDHARRPHRAGLREPFTVEVHQVNPTCGDEVTMRLLLAGDGRSGAGARVVVQDVSYEALGCSISVAATSVLAEAVTGRPLDEALARYDGFHDLVTGATAPDPAGFPVHPADTDATDDARDDTDDDMVAFAGVAKFPGRVKCALLGWSAFREAVVRADR